MNNSNDQPSLFAEFDLTGCDARPDAEPPPPPRHGPLAEAVYVPVTRKKRVEHPDGRITYHEWTEMRWKLRLNAMGQKFVEDYLAKYPEPARLAHRQAPGLADDLFASRNDGEEANQLARRFVVDAALRFDPERVSVNTGRVVNPKAFLAQFIMGAFWRTWKLRFDDVDGMIRPDQFERTDPDAAVTWANAETVRKVLPEDARVDAAMEAAELLDRLPDLDAKLLKWSYGACGLEQLTEEQIAARTGIPVEQVAGRVKASEERMRFLAWDRD